MLLDIRQCESETYHLKEQAFAVWKITCMVNAQFCYHLETEIQDTADSKPKILCFLTHTCMYYVKHVCEQYIFFELKEQQQKS